MVKNTDKYNLDKLTNVELFKFFKSKEQNNFVEAKNNIKLFKSLKSKAQNNSFVTSTNGEDSLSLSLSLSLNSQSSMKKLSLSII